MKLGKKELALIEGWRDGWRFYSTWAYVLLINLPSLYDQAVAAGLVETETIPGPAKWAIRAVALYGLVARFVAQNKPAVPPA